LLCQMAALLMPLLAVIPAHGQAPAAPTRPAPASADDLTAAIAQLGADDFAVREKGTKTLWTAGRRAEALLRQAAKSDDPEKAGRARALLQKLQMGLTPDAPPALLAQVEEFSTADADHKTEIINNLLQDGKRPLLPLRLAQSEVDDDLREALVTTVLLQGRGVLQILLAEGDEDAEGLLERSVKLPGEAGSFAARNYAAYLLLQGKAEKKIAQLKPLAADEPAGPWATALVWLYRGKGDLAEAQQRADHLSQRQTERQLAQIAGNWTDAWRMFEASNLNLPGKGPGLDLPALAAGYCRLSAHDASGKGAKPADIEEAIGKLLAVGQAMAKDDASNNFATYHLAMCLFLLSRPAEAERFLSMDPRNRPMLFELYEAQERFDDALKLLEIKDSPPVDGNDAARATAAQEAGETQRLLIMLGVRTHLMMGEVDKAKTAVEELRKECEALSEEERPARYIQIAELEKEAGLKDKAMARQAVDDVIKVLRFFRDSSDRPAGSEIFAPIFGDRGGEAAAWWGIFRQKNPGEPLLTSWGRLEELMEGKLGRAEVLAMANDFCDAMSKPHDHPDERGDDAGPIAQTLLAYGDDAAAQATIEHLASLDSDDEPLVKLGDRAAAARDFAEATRWYAKAVEKDRSSAWKLYLWGWALTQGGQAAEGRRLTELADLMPLADSDLRMDMYRELRQRKLQSSADRQIDLILKYGSPDDFSYPQALRAMSVRLEEQGRYTEAADAVDAGLLPMMAGNTTFEQSSAYVRIPAEVNLLRARGLLAKEDVAGAMAEARLALACCPGHIDTATALMPGLEKLGRQKEADELFAGLFARYEQSCRAHPTSAFTHNNLAWLCACCHRKLDLALEHATKAVELNGEDYASVDTLAEVYFHRGQRDLAIATEKKCVEKQPDAEIFKKHLAEYQEKPIPTGAGE